MWIITQCFSYHVLRATLNLLECTSEVASISAYINAGE